jgi:hypothetical protein
MPHSTRIPIVLFVLTGGLLAGCSSSAPTMPSASPMGSLELTTDSPDGAALVVTQCYEEGGLFPCTLDLHMRFSVVLNTGVDRALVQTNFYLASGRLCGATKTEMVSLTPGTPATLTASSVFLGLQGNATPAECGFPLQTTRIVAQLWRVRNTGQDDVLLTQQFFRTYTFVTP